MKTKGKCDVSCTDRLLKTIAGDFLTTFARMSKIFYCSLQYCTYLFIKNVSFVCFNVYNLMQNAQNSEI